MSVGWPSPPDDGSGENGPFQTERAIYGYGYGGGALRPLQGLATATSVLLGVMAGLTLLVVAMIRRFVDVARDYVLGTDPSDKALDDAVGLVGVTVIVFVVGFIATAAVFITWQYRHAVNAEVLGGRNGLAPGWSIGGWFIPCANIILPAITLWQASQASDPDLSSGRQSYTGRGNWLVIPWAICWGLTGITNNRFDSNVDTTSRTLTTAEKLDALDKVQASSTMLFLSALTAVLAIAMVQSMTRRQAARAEAYTASLAAR